MLPKNGVYCQATENRLCFIRGVPAVNRAYLEGFIKGLNVKGVTYSLEAEVSSSEYSIRREH